MAEKKKQSAELKMAHPVGGEILLYQTPQGDVRVECLFQDETIWLTQKVIAALFGVGVPAISKHLKNIFESGELLEKATVSKMETVRSEGTREVKRLTGEGEE